MRRKIYLIATLIAAAALSGAAEAGETAAYSATDIVRHFAPGPRAGRDAKLGATRSICIGSGTDCGDSLAPAQSPAPFDLEISFELGSDRLTAVARGNLDEFAKALTDPSLTDRRFFVDGHTDGRGGDDMNMKLSRRRAETVKDYLVDAGIGAERLTAQGYGKARPKTDDPLDAANRRVETRIAD